MPLKWVEPYKVFTHRGISIYCTYKNDDYENPSTYWFTTDVTEDKSENEKCEFDIRDLPLYQDLSTIKVVFKNAIDDNL